jgi:hypothetical protein
MERLYLGERQDVWRGTAENCVLLCVHAANCYVNVALTVPVRENSVALQKIIKNKIDIECDICAP